MYLSATIDGKLVSRPYTPVTSDDEQGCFQLIIKVSYTHTVEPGHESCEVSLFCTYRRIPQVTIVERVANQCFVFVLFTYRSILLMCI